MQSTTVRPITLLLSSLAYFYNSVNNVSPFRSRSSANSALIDMNYGTLRGTIEVSRTGRSYYAFKAIPYAAPPLEYLRFEPPEPPQPWDGIRDATRYGSQCLQMNIITRRTLVGDEDCLFLNVFTHTIVNSRRKPVSSLNPVIVFIHGGLFMSGGSNIYRPKYFMDEDVVLVTVNYRLTSFGFLNTGDGVVTGNMGLKDQNMALRWIQENIADFGGDPTRVTLMGESAGAASVHLHTLSPMSRGLFHRVISMSGSALSPWGLIDETKEQSREFAQELGCPTHPTRQMVRCLKTLDARRIARFHFGYISKLADKKRSVFGPSVEKVINENTFLPASPIDLMKSGRINPVPWIAGVNSEEGLVYLISIIRNSTMNYLVNSDWETYAPIVLNLHKSEVTPKLLKDIRKYYLNNSDIELSTMAEAINMLSDRAFFLDNHDAAVLHSRVAPVYAYYYKYSGRYAMAKLLFVKSPIPFPIPDRYDFALGTGISWFTENVLRFREPNYFGVGHSDEIPLFFNAPIVRREVTPDDEDYGFSRRVVKLWSSFAQTGVPNSRVVGGPKWKPILQEQSGNYSLDRLHLDDKILMADEPFFERLKFWKYRNITYV